MRLLHVVPTYLPATRYGGPIYSVHGLCRALAAQGHEVHVLTTNVDGDGDSAVPLDREVALDGVRVRYYPSRVLRRLYYAPALQERLAAEVGGYDLVHLHSVFLWPTSAAARLAARTRVPYVVSPRGMLVRELIARKSKLIKSAWLTLIESETLARAAAVHLTSERELADARELALPLPAPFVVGNGVDGPTPDYAVRASARVRAVREQGPYALYLGRVHWKKGLETAIRALPGTNVRLVIAGNDEEGQRPALEQLARELGCSERVSFEPPVHGDDKWALLAGARFALLPSINENFGNVVLEAMAVGRPVIVSAGVGTAALVERSGSGLVVDANPGAWREALARLWEEPALVEQMGRAARVAAGGLGWSAVAERMSEHYGRLIAQRAVLA